MSIVAGVDFGTLSVRVSVFDSTRGRLGAGVAEYLLHRKKDNPDYATQSHVDHIRALAEATHRAIQNAGIDGSAIEAIALDTTGSSVIPVALAWQTLTINPAARPTTSSARTRACRVRTPANTFLAENPAFTRV